MTSNFSVKPGFGDRLISFLVRVSLSSVWHLAGMQCVWHLSDE